MLKYLILAATVAFGSIGNSNQLPRVYEGEITIVLRSVYEKVLKEVVQICETEGAWGDAACSTHNASGFRLAVNDEGGLFAFVLEKGPFGRGQMLMLPIDGGKGFTASIAGFEINSSEGVIGDQSLELKLIYKNEVFGFARVDKVQ